MVMTSFLLPIKLGQPINRIVPDEILPYVDPHEWQAFCDAFDRLSLNLIDKNGNILMRLSLTIAILSLVLVVLFGYLGSEEDDEDSSATSSEDSGSEDGSVSTVLVLVTAIPICFPFVMAAVLNCHGASTVSRLLDLCRTECDKWAAAKAVKATVEQIQSVSNQDEVVDKFLIQFDSIPAENDIEKSTPQEASPEAAKR